MSRPLKVLPLALALAVKGCAWGGTPAPTLLAVAPTEAPNHLDVELTVEGRDFDPAVTIDFDSPGSSAAPAFSISLVSATSRIPLGPVVRASAGELRATVAAGGPPGSYDVEVRDPRGHVVTLPEGFRLYQEVAVTTASDESDPGATPTNPMGTGLSLREAITWVNGLGAPRRIKLSAPITITMTPPQTGMTLTAPGAEVVGERGVVLDFGGIAQNCFTLGGPDERLVGVTLMGWEGTFVFLSSSSGGAQVTGVTTEVTNPAKLYFPNGITATATAPSRIGPGNDLSGLWIALNITGTGYDVFGNRVHGNAVGARVTGGALRFWQNLFFAQVKGGSNKGLGMDLVAGAGPLTVVHNVFHANGGSGISAGAIASLTVRDNLFTGNAGTAMAVTTGAVFDHNGFFGNAAGVTTDPTTDVLADPLYVDAAGGDFHLLAGSPAIDAGLDTGLDVNGAALGLFTGLAPDLGAFESW